ncbi:myosin-11-like [Hibiscus syriacus]|uniref:Myosin-11-like n=1 Tax=Hibiscus syriacus TaxID=106335 RepID=A0A6A3A486_HIBSY|nr:myosin-11-like [Hibiscus syriacus]
MQQKLMQMQPMIAAYYPNNVTTDHIEADADAAHDSSLLSQQRGSGALGAGGFPDFGRGSSREGIHGGKQDIGRGGSAEGRGGSSGGQGGDGGETLYLKAADERN